MSAKRMALAAAVLASLLCLHPANAARSRATRRAPAPGSGREGPPALRAGAGAAERAGGSPAAARRPAASAAPTAHRRAPAANASSGPLALHRKKSSTTPPKIGAGFSLVFQTNPLDVNFAAQKVYDMGIRSIRLWNYDTAVLTALNNVGIKDVLVNVPTGSIAQLATDKAFAVSVAAALKPFHDSGMVLRVGVGNEPLQVYELNAHDTTIVPACRNMQAALIAGGLTGVTISVPFANPVLTGTYPPENGYFRDDARSLISEVAEIIHANGGEFVIHLYPWFDWIYGGPTLDIALGQESHSVNGKTYSGSLHMGVAAVRAALTRLNSAYATMPITIGETGWPSDGHDGATMANAGAYLSHVLAVAPTLDPYIRTVYYFESFDEGAKGLYAHGGRVNEFENHFGIMEETGATKHAGVTFPGDDASYGAAATTGAPKPDCSKNAAAGPTCQDRVIWVMDNLGKSKLEAWEQVSSEFPAECGCSVCCNCDGC